MAVRFTRGLKRILNYDSGADEVRSQGCPCARIGGLLTQWLMHMGMCLIGHEPGWQTQQLSDGCCLYTHWGQFMAWHWLQVLSYITAAPLYLNYTRGGVEMNDLQDLPSVLGNRQSTSSELKHSITSASQTFKQMHYSEEAISLNHRLLKVPDGERTKPWSMHIKLSAEGHRTWCPMAVLQKQDREK